MPRRRMVPCPHCGEMFKAGRLSCPSCGADAKTGWLSPVEQDLLAVDTNFTSLEDGDYELFLESEGLRSSGQEEPRPPKPRRRKGARTVSEGRSPLAAILMLLALAATALVIALTSDEQKASSTAKAVK